MVAINYIKFMIGKDRSKVKPQQQSHDDVLKLKAKIRSQATKILALECATCRTCDENRRTAARVTKQVADLRQTLRSEVVLNESMAAYLDHCCESKTTVSADWRSKVSTLDNETKQYVSDLLLTMAAEERHAREDELECRLTELDHKSKGDLVVVANMKADADSRLLNTTKFAADLGTDVFDIYTKVRVLRRICDRLEHDKQRHTSALHRSQQDIVKMFHKQRSTVACARSAIEAIDLTASELSK